MTHPSKNLWDAGLVVLFLLLVALFREPITGLLKQQPPAGPFLKAPGSAAGATRCLHRVAAFNAEQTAKTAAAVERICLEESLAMGLGPCRQWASRARLVGLWFGRDQDPDAADRLRLYRTQAAHAAGLCSAAG